MVEESIVASVARYLKAVDDSGIPVRFGVIFGSQVTGETHEWSDIDVMVVSPVFDPPRNRDDIVNLWQIAGDIDNRIEPIPCGAIQWVEDDGTPIYEVARQQGVIVNLPENAVTEVKPG